MTYVQVIRRFMYHCLYVEQRRINQNWRYKLLCLFYTLDYGLQLKTGKHGLVDHYHGNVSHENLDRKQIKQ